MPSHLVLLRNGVTNQMVKKNNLPPQQSTAFSTETFQCNLVLLPLLLFVFFNHFFFLLSYKEEEK